MELTDTLLIISSPDYKKKGSLIYKVYRIFVFLCWHRSFWPVAQTTKAVKSYAHILTCGCISLLCCFHCSSCTFCSFLCTLMMYNATGCNVYWNKTVESEGWIFFLKRILTIRKPCLCGFVH